MVAAEIAAGITAAVLRDEVKSQFLSLVKSSVNEYSKNPDFKNFLDKIQQEVYHYKTVVYFVVSMLRL